MSCHLDRLFPTGWVGGRGVTEGQWREGDGGEEGGKGWEENSGREGGEKGWRGGREGKGKKEERKDREVGGKVKERNKMKGRENRPFKGNFTHAI